MKDNNLIEFLHSIRNLAPREEISSSIKMRVFEVVHSASAPVASPTEPWRRFLDYFRSNIFVLTTVAFVVVLVIANQLPMYGTYQSSISSIVTAEQLAETLNKTTDPVATAHDVKTATAATRATLDSLKLKGQFGVYSQKQCLHAYIIYDSYLDYLGDYLDGQIAITKDEATLATFKDLRAYVQDSHEEAQRRINMYPPKS